LFSVDRIKLSYNLFIADLRLVQTALVTAAKINNQS